MQESPNHYDKVADEVCLTPGCVKAAASLLDIMDQSKDPCEDFFEFACGKFLQETVMPDLDSKTGPDTILQEKVN